MEKPKHKLPIIHKFKCPITAPQLFQPITTVFLDNLTYEEQLLGMFKKLNELIEQYNTLSELVQQFPEQIAELQESVTALTTYLNNEIQNLLNEIYNGDEKTYKKSRNYTDLENQKIQKQIDNLIMQNDPVYDPTTGIVDPVQVVVMNIYESCRCGALTAGEYDSLELTAEGYDNHQLSAKQYDQHAKSLLR